MKKLILLAAYTILLGAISHAQIQKLFDFGYDNDLQDPAFYEQPIEDGTYIYGMTEYGGAHNSGGIYRVKPDGTDFTKLHDFDWNSIANGSRPQGGLTLVGSNLYGMTAEGGAYNDGCIFKINKDGSGFIIIHNFQYAISGKSPKGTLTFFGGMLYGTATEGGTPPLTPDEHYGTLFRLNTDGSGFTVLHNFSYLTGANPYGKLTHDGNLLYGTLSYGAGPSSTGCLYKFDLNDNSFTVLHVFAYLTGATPYGSVTKVGNYLYGTASNGNYPNDAGVIFKFNLISSEYIIVHGFSGDDGRPMGDLVQSGDKLYFINRGSSYVSSYVYELDLANSDALTLLIDLEHETYNANHSQTGGSVLVIGNLLYATVANGPSDYGYMFSITKSGTEFTRRLIFKGTSDGRFPEGKLIAEGGYFYGMTPEGGADEQGCIFRINQDGTGYNRILDFNGVNGREPYGSLLYNDGALYGTASEGGDYDYGVVFKINPDGSGFTILHHFNQIIDGSGPLSNLILSDGILYGTTSYGPSGVEGAIFKINTDGTGFGILHSFTNYVDGGYPKGSLIKSGNKLYGMAVGGGANYHGTIFSCDLSGANFANIHNFTGSEGSSPSGSLTLVGSTLYGMTPYGGEYNGGVLFSIETNGSSFSVIRHLDNTGRSPKGTLILNGGKLYGLTHNGGNNDSGTVFDYDITQDTFTTLASFTGNNGLNPYGDLIRVGDDFYGMSRNGGTADNGILFRYSPAIQWTGAFGTAWSDGSNWNKGEVPSGEQDVVILSSPANQPHVDQGFGSPAQCNNLTIEPGASVTIDPGKALTVAGNLTNQAGNAGLIIESNATGTGSLIHNTDNTQATVKRYITGDADLTLYKYHLVSIPVEGDNFTAGLFTGSYLFSFDPYIQDWTGMGNDPENPLFNNQGYMIYYPGNATTYTFSGPLSNGSKGYNLYQNEDEYQLIPNPYPSAIDWDSPDMYKYQLHNAIWIWNPATGNYAAYGSQAGINSGTRYIPQGQSFFVRGTSDVSYLGFYNEVRVHNTQSYYKDAPENQLRIRATGNNYSDEALIRFTPDGLTGEDAADVAKLGGNADAPQLSTLVDGHKISINTLPALSGSVTIPMHFETTFSGQVTLNFSQLESFPGLVPVYLVDETNNETIDLRKQATYEFDHTPGTSNDRFKLVIGAPNGSDSQQKITDKIWISDGFVFINALTANNESARLEIFTPDGRKTTDQTIVLNEITRVAVMEQGLVIVRITTSDSSLTCKGIISNRQSW